MDELAAKCPTGDLPDAVTKAKKLLQDFVEEQQGTIQKIADEVVREYSKEVAMKKARLDKVAGGAQDGSSWKAHLKPEMKLEDGPVQKAIQNVKQAFVTAIEKRTTEANEATWMERKWGSYRLRLCV